MSISNLIYIIFLEAILTLTMIYSYKKISNCELKLNWQKILVITMEILIISLNNIYNLLSIRIICSFIISILLNKLLFKENIKKTIFYTFAYSVISILCELLISLLITSNLKNINFINNTVWAKTLFNFINILILILFFSNKKITNFIRKIQTSVNKSFYVYILLFMNFINTIEILRLENLSNDWILGIAIMNFTYTIISIIIIITEKRSNLILADKNNNIISTNQAYKKIVDECSELKHNFKHDLYSLKLIDKKDINDSIEELIKKYNKKYEWINDLGKIPEGIQGIIYLKQKEAEKNNVKIIANVKEIKEKYNNIINISNILGILIDNAIEAAKNTSNKFVIIDFSEDNLKLKISILNNFNNEIDLDLIGNKKYSTKKRNSGIGLNYIKKIQNKNIKVYYNIENNVFISKIELIKNK